MRGLQRRAPDRFGDPAGRARAEGDRDIRGAPRRCAGFRGRAPWLRRARRRRSPFRACLGWPMVTVDVALDELDRIVAFAVAATDSLPELLGIVDDAVGAAGNSAGCASSGKSEISVGADAGRSGAAPARPVGQEWPAGPAGVSSPDGPPRCRRRRRVQRAQDQVRLRSRCPGRYHLAAGRCRSLGVDAGSLLTSARQRMVRSELSLCASVRWPRGRTSR